MQEEQQLEKAILITNISSPLTWAVTLESNNERYLVPKTTKDGNQTKAFTQLQEIRPMVGDTVNAMVKETPNTYVNKVGKTINGVNRIIMYFITKRDAIPVIQAQPAQTYPQAVNVAPNSMPTSTPAPVAQPAPADTRIELMQGQINNLIERLNDLEREKKEDIPTINVDEDPTYPEDVRVSDVPF